MRSRLTLALLALVVALSACRAPEPETEEGTGAPTAPAEVPTETPELDRGAVGLIRDRYTTAVNDGNLDELMSVWADDAVLMPPDQPAVTGKEAIRAWYETMLGQFDAEATLRPAETQISGNWGFDRGTYTLTLTPKAPPAPAAPASPPAAPPATPEGSTAAPAPTTPPAADAPPVAEARPVGPSQTVTAKYLVLVKRGEGGSWQVMRYIWNFDAPPAARARGAAGAGAAGPGATGAPASPPAQP